MDTKQVADELTAIAQEAGATACKVRAAARAKLGSDIEHPLIVFGPGGATVMRILASKDTIWVPVPAAWMKL